MRKLQDSSLVGFSIAFCLEPGFPLVRAVVVPAGMLDEEAMPREAALGLHYISPDGIGHTLETIMIRDPQRKG